MSYRKTASDKEYSKPVVEVARTISIVLGKLLWRVKFHGRENIPKNLSSGLIIASNHQTYLDPFLISIPIEHKLRFMAWDKAFEWPLIGRTIRKLGAFPMSLKEGGTISGLKKSIEILTKGESLAVFPEASREFSDGKLLPFKTGAVKLAIKTNTPILPVAIRGANRIWSQDHRYPRPGKVDVYYHPLIEIRGPKKGESMSELVIKETDKLREVISSAPL